MQDYIPKSAQVLLDFIRRTEVGTSEPEGYGVIYGHNQRHLKKPLTEMTVLEVQQQQQNWTMMFGSSAAGGYQFMYKTLGGLIEEFKLDINRVFNSDLQDDLGYALLIRRGFQKWTSREIDNVDFAKQLAQEWASFPVLRATKGAHRDVVRGQSYYAGDGVNKALVKPEQVEAKLEEARGAGKAAAGVAPKVMTPKKTSTTVVPTMPAKEVSKSKSAGIAAGVVLIVVLVVYLLASL